MRYERVGIERSKAGPPRGAWAAAGIPTVMVAASNASKVSRSMASYLCDGTNDEVEINAAINSVAATGGRVVLSEGLFKTLDRIIVPVDKHFFFEGMGMGITTIMGQTGFVASKGLLETAGGGHITVADLTLAAKANGAVDAAAYAFHPLQAGADTIHLVRIEAKNASSHGLYLDRTASWGVVLDCLVHDNGARGIHCAGEGTWDLIGCTIRNNVGDGLRLTTYSTITGCEIHHNAKGIAAGGIAQQRVIVYGNQIYSNTGLSIDFSLSDAGPHAIIANTIHNNGTNAPSMNSGFVHIVAHNAGLGSGDHSDINLADLGSGAATDNQVIAADGVGGAAWEYPDGFDRTAIHDDTAAEISAVAEKTAPVAADLVLIEDSAATNAKKRVQIGNLTEAVSPLTTKGDLWGYAAVDARVPVGTNGQVLTADSVAVLGVKWDTPAALSFRQTLLLGGM